MSKKKTTTPPVVIRWLGAFRWATSEISRQLSWELGQQARPVSATVIWDRNNEFDLGFLRRSRIGLVVDTRNTRLVVGFSSDVWSEHVEGKPGSKLRLNARRRASKKISTWKDLPRLRFRNYWERNDGGSWHCEVVIDSPDYVGIMVSPGSNQETHDLARLASKLTGLPIIRRQTD